MKAGQAKIIDGKAVAAEIRAGLKKEIAQLKKQYNFKVGLGAILDADYAPSKIYVGMKEKGCQEVGIISKIIPIKKNQKAVLAAVTEFNRDPEIHGILVQLPLPKEINTDEVIAAIDPKKDADGLHPINLGKLFMGKPAIEPCTPSGIIRLLDSIDCNIAGKHAVVVGRSNIVGKPVAQLLLGRDATVTICHSRSRDLQTLIKSADILVAAVGKPEMILGNWIKPGAVVIDVGINREDDGKLMGDVDFAGALKTASYITPVPGGVGPMTVAMLLYNTVQLAKQAHGIRS